MKTKAQKRIQKTAGAKSTMVDLESACDLMLDADWRKPDVGPVAFQFAKQFCRCAMRLALDDNPPDWMKRIAPHEYEIPWMLVNGKPAPGHEVLQGWGRAVTKRGKSRFDAPQTRQAAWALRLLNIMRNAPAGCGGVLDGENVYAIPRDLRKLPPFARSTVAMWWPFVCGLIRETHGAWMTDKERSAIKRATTYHTDAEAENEYMKRVKVALVGLAPD